MSGMTPLDAALAYATAGWYVLPTDPGDIKNPGSIVQGRWQDKSNRETAQIRRWWTEQPDAGIALHVGRSGAVVFDLDVDDLDALPTDVATALRRGAVQLTRQTGDRGHYAFTTSLGEQFSNSAKGFTRYGEVRGRNGVIIAEPTPHASGGQYRWTEQRPVPELPGVLRELLTAAVDHADPKPAPELTAFLVAHRREERPAALKGQLTEFANKIDDGASRHNSMCSVLVWAFREAITGCYGAQRACEELREAFETAKPERESGEFDRIAQWAAAQAELVDPAETLAHLYRNEITREIDRLRIRDLARERYAGDRAQERLMVNAERAVTGLAFLSTDTDAKPLWGRDQQVLWAAGEGLMIVGPQGVGKSTIVQQLVLSRLGLTDPGLFGFPVAADDRPVLYLAMDRPPQIRRSLARMVDLTDETTAATLKRQLVVWTGPLPFDAAGAPDAFAQWVALHGNQPGLVIVDSLKDLATGLAKDDVGAGVNAAMQRVLANGTEFVSLHHQRKPTVGNAKPDKLADVYGSSWLTAGVGSVLLLWGVPGGMTVELSHLKQPQDQVGPLIINHTHLAGQSVAADPIERLKEIAKLAGADGFTEAQAVRDLYGVGRGDEGYPAARAKTRRKLDRLTADQFLLYNKGLPGGLGGGGKPAKWTYAPAKRTTS
jgi:hypothetical protein